MSSSGSSMNAITPSPQLQQHQSHQDTQFELFNLEEQQHFANSEAKPPASHADVDFSPSYNCR